MTCPALMPPLCTAGYGLANGNWSFFFGAFYLFLINSVFIALSTWIIVKYLKFPLATYISYSLFLARNDINIAWQNIILLKIFFIIT